MPTLAGWLTGEQVAHEVIDQTLVTLSEVLGRHGGQLARTIQPGAGLIAYSDMAYAMRRNDEPAVLDWVPQRRTMVYHRPLSGAHPLYYIENWPARGNLLFASEIKALLALGVPRRLNLAALDALLRYGFIPAPLTALKDIFVVPAGSILRWQRAKTVVNQALDYRLHEPLPAQDALEQLQHLIDSAVDGTLPPQEQPLAALSHGDSVSALVTFLAARHTEASFPIVTLGANKRIDAHTWRDAEEMASQTGRPFLAITGVDAPEFWLASIAGLEAPAVDTRPLAWHQLLHTASVETGMRIALTGLGGKLLCASQPAQGSGEYDARDLLRWYRETLTATASSGLWSREAAALLQREEPWEESLYARKLVRQAQRFSDHWRRWYYLDLHLRLPDAIVGPAQQVAVPERVALRSPYLHKDVLDLLARMPIAVGGRIPRPTLPQEILQRYTEYRPRGTPPPLQLGADSLLKPDTSDLLQQTLSPHAIEARGIFDPQAVGKLLGRGKASRELLLVFTTQLFCQILDVSL